MRITENQKKFILQSAKNSFGQDVKVWLFGSRANDLAKGGDVDLYIETLALTPWLPVLQCKMDMEDHLDLKVDLLVNDASNPLPIHKIARQTGLLL